MGRIKSLMVKRAAKQLLVAKAEIFTSSFEHNKKVLGNTLPSKSTRNKVAGYIGHVIRMKEVAALKPAPKPEQMEEAPQE